MADMDTPENREKIPEDFANSARTLGRRGTFMAAFSYYQIGRFMYAGPETPSIAYIFFNTSAFLASVLCAGVSVAFLYYLTRLKTTEEKYDYCMRALTQYRLVTRLYSFTGVLYTLGIGFMGFQYFPENDMRYVVLAIMFLGLSFYIYGVRTIVYNQLLLQSNFLDGVNIMDSDQIVAASKHGKRAGINYVDYIYNEASIISGRAQFIAGLSQFAILRYCPYPYCLTAKNAAGDLFAFFATVACSTSFSAGNVLTFVTIFLPDTLKDKQLAMGILCTDITQTSFGLYIVAFFCLLLSIVFCGWGTDTPSKYDPIFCIFGIMGFVWVLILLLRSYKIHKIMEREEEEKLEGESNESIQNKSKTEESALCARAVKAILTRSNSAGGMATFAAGYLNYNLCTMETDVFSLSYVEDDASAARAFVTFNVLSVTLAFVACVLDSILTQFASDFRTHEFRQKFLQSQQIISTSCTVLYNLTLFTWFWVFGLIGIVKYSRNSYIPTYYAIIGIVGLIFGFTYLRQKFIMHTKTSNDDELDDGNTEQQSVALSRVTVLNTIAFSVIFLGGYAYYNVLFFNFHQRNYQLEYLHSMSLCFMVSIWVMVLSDGYVNTMTLIVKFSQKKAFARDTFPFYFGILALSYICVVALLLGLSFIGYIKVTTVNMESVCVIIFTVGAITTLVISAPIVWSVALIFKIIAADDSNSKHSRQSNLKQSREIMTKASYRSDEARLYGEKYYEAFTGQLSEEAWTAGFIAGNVCYEILFTDLVSKYHIVNSMYMVFLTATFAFSLAAIIISITVILLFGELRTTQAKLLFASRIKYVKKILFMLSFGSLLTWLLASCFMAEAKYSGAKKVMWPSCVFGSIASVCLIYIFYRVKTASDRVRVYWRDNDDPKPSKPCVEFSILRLVMSPFYVGLVQSDKRSKTRSSVTEHIEKKV